MPEPESGEQDSPPLVEPLPAPKQGFFRRHAPEAAAIMAAGAAAAGGVAQNAEAATPPYHNQAPYYSVESGGVQYNKLRIKPGQTFKVGGVTFKLQRVGDSGMDQYDLVVTDSNDLMRWEQNHPGQDLTAYVVSPPDEVTSQPPSSLHLGNNVQHTRWVRNGDIRPATLNKLHNYNTLRVPDAVQQPGAKVEDPYLMVEVDQLGTTDGITPSTTPVEVDTVRLDIPPPHN